ncbi:MAG: hypothetical protein AAF414_17150 [Pseudomonadota bacterium]
MPFSVRGTALAAVTAASIVLGAPPSLAQGQAIDDYRDVTEFLGAGDYPAAVEALAQRADQGEELAQLLLGELYLSGMGSPPNPQLAIAWFRRAAVAGNAHAMVRLGQVYQDMSYPLSGEPFGTWPTAAGWFVMAAAAGSPAGAAHAGLIFSSGTLSRETELISREAETALARRYFEQAAEAGNGRARWQLAMTHRDEPDFLDHMRQAAEGMDGIVAQHTLGLSDWVEEGVTPREQYRWALITQRNLELSGVHEVFGDSAEDIAVMIEDIAAGLDETDRGTAEAEAEAFTADWVDLYP